MGALNMTMRPFFPASEVLSLHFRPVDTIASALAAPYSRTGCLSPSLQDFNSANNVCPQIVELTEDISAIALIGVTTIQQQSRASGEATLIEMRDVLLHRLLSLTPLNQDDDGEHSPEECTRLTLLVLTLDRLFHPILPPLYHNILQHIADKLSAALSENADAAFWSKYAMILLWITFVAATVHEGDRKTKQTFIRSAGPACDQLFSTTIPSAEEVHEVLNTVMRGPEMYDTALVRGFVDDLEEELGPQ